MLSLLPALVCFAAPPAETLAFRVDEGDIQNAFYRRGPVAAHVLARGGARPRVVFAFPAGNSGAGLWFEAPGRPAPLSLEGALVPVDDGAMRGVTATVTSPLETLVVRRAVLGSVRALRDFEHTGRVPPEMELARAVGPPVVWSRTSVDGRRRFRLSLEPLAGTRAELRDGRLTLRGAGGLKLRITATDDEPPLTPIPIRELLTPAAAADPRARDAIAFLSYDEKLLAGSWRFATYFGRDTLLSLRLLMPVLTPRAIEAGLGAVLTRLASDGAVAHEEDIGEWATLDHRRAGRPTDPPDAPVFDYKMIDDDFLLAPVVAHYLLDTKAGAARAHAFLARHGAALRRNLDLVRARARPYAAAPSVAHLVALKAGETVGEWRDSEEGLGGGRIPFDVNAALVPAALEAAARLYAHPALGPDEAAAAEARRLAAAWSGSAAHFQVTRSAAEANAQRRAYAAALGLPEPAAARGPVLFPALALDAAGAPIPVMSSDDGFVLLFRTPAPEVLDRVADRILAPFPAGLRTPVGLVVANPVYAPARQRPSPPGTTTARSSGPGSRRSSPPGSTASSPGRTCLRRPART